MIYNRSKIKKFRLSTALFMLFAVLVCVAIVLGFVIYLESTNQIDRGESTEAPITVTPDISTPTPAPTEEPTATATSEPTSTPAPTPLQGLVICIDPGHQQTANNEKEPSAPWDSSCNETVNNTVMKTKTASGTQGCATGIPEYVINLEVALKVRDTLRNLGATVVMVRETDDVNISNIERAEIGNACNADLVIRIHCDGAENTAANGIGLWIRGNGDGTAEYKALQDYEYKLANELLDYLVTATGANRRYVNKSDSYTGLNWSKVPSIILECGFMSNEDEDRRLATDEYQQKFADGIALWLIKSEAELRKSK